MVLFLEAFILALASSTDNFMVGLSVGITNRHLSVSVNVLISICNAAGAWLASIGGNIIGENLPSFVSPLLSAITFGGLALQEFLEFIRTVQRKKQRRQQKQQRGNENNDVIAKNNFSDISNSSSSCDSGTSLDISRALQLAFPMTLNNLAGGVAGGAIGVSPLQAGIFGLLASFLTMALGHSIGLYFARLSNKNNDKNKNETPGASRSILLDPSLVSASLLGILCLVSLQELLSSSTSP